MKRERMDDRVAGGSPADMGRSGPSRGPGKQTLTEQLTPPVQARPATAPSESADSPSRAQPLRPDVRSHMEASFGADFSAVRVHESGLAEAMGAQAFARGNEIHMASGRHDPDSRSGRELLGHELAHVVQQSQGRVAATGQAKGTAINQDPALEAEADVAGERAARGEPAGVGPAGEIMPRAAAPAQGKFALVQPDNDDSYLYGWVDGDAEGQKPQGAYQWLGNYADLGGAPGDLLLNTETDTLWYCRNMFGKSPPREWKPNEKNHVDLTVLEHARANVPMHMRKREPTPSGDIGKMDFRFPSAGGVLYYVNAPPHGVDPTKYPDVRFIKVDSSTLQAHATEHQVDRLGEGYDQENYVPGQYLYVRPPPTVVDVDTKPRNERSKYTFKGGSFDQPTPELMRQIRTAADELDAQGGSLLQRQEMVFTAEARGKSRDDGQCAAMHGMNAAGYALARGAPGSEATDWEWLHIRGARLGGATSAINLVAGTSSANSHMIPYEHWILEMSRWSSSKQPLQVTWTVQAQGRLGMSIEIAWNAPAGLTREDGFFMKQNSGSRTFNPISGEIFDRLSRDIAWEQRMLPPVPAFPWPSGQGGAPGGNGAPGGDQGSPTSMTIED